MDLPAVSPPVRFGPDAKIAVIGAGISGVCTAAHALKQDLDVTVFERSTVAGGVWHFDERVADNPSFPSETPSVGDYVASTPGQFAYRTPPPEPVEPDTVQQEARTSEALQHDYHPLENPDGAGLEISFAPPGPCYGGLKNNVPTSLMVSSLGRWPDGTGENTSQQDIERYVQRIAQEHGVDAVTQYSTRVENVKKPSASGSKWLVRTLSLQKRMQKPRLVEKTWEFDAVIVASGHYNLPRVPDLKGLARWRRLFADRVTHSKRYRRPQDYRDRNILLVGAGVSSLDICRELDGVAAKSYQSSRGGLFDLPPHWLPPSGERVEAVEEFILDDDEVRLERPLSTSQAIPGRESDADPTLLVTAGGDMCHNLHKDIFYIPDPSLVFIGVPYHIATFSLFDFQAQLVARVLAGKAFLPGEDDMRREYTNRVALKGLGRPFHSLRASGAEVAYVNDLVAWANRGADKLGIEHMAGHSEAWKESRARLKEKIEKLFSGQPALE